MAVDLLRQRPGRHRRRRCCRCASSRSRGVAERTGVDLARRRQRDRRAHPARVRDREDPGLRLALGRDDRLWPLARRPARRRSSSSSCRSKAPLVRLGIFRTRSLTAANLAMLAVAGGMFAVFYFASLYVQEILGFTPVQAGLAFLPLTAGIILFSGIAQQLIGRVGRARGRHGRHGDRAASACCCCRRRRWTARYATDVLPGLLVMSVGLGLTFVPLTLIATTNVGRRATPGSPRGSSTRRSRSAARWAWRSSPPSRPQHDHRARCRAGANPSPIEQATALVDGYQVAFAVGAGLMLRRRDHHRALHPPPRRRRDPGGRGRRPSRVSDPATLRSDARRNRARIIAAASELFAESGADLSVDEIARRAGRRARDGLPALPHQGRPGAGDVRGAPRSRSPRSPRRPRRSRTPGRACGPRWSTSPPSRSATGGCSRPSPPR